jgi:hypothetical protein
LRRTLPTWVVSALLLAALLGLATGGCAWIVGVSKDVVEIDDAGSEAGGDGGDEADAP